MANRELLVEHRAGIYCWRNLCNGKRYVGSTIDLAVRMRQHRGDLRAGRHFNDHLQRAWNSYGESNFLFEVLELVEESSLSEREGFWIDTLKALTSQNGYNLRPLVDDRFQMPEEVRIRISSKLKGRTKTDEHRLKISLARKGQSPSQSWKWPSQRQESLDAQRPKCRICGKDRAFRIKEGKRIFQKLCGSPECLKKAQGVLR